MRTDLGLAMVMFHLKCIENCKTNDQLAHIAAHEISHLILKHPNALTSSMSFLQEYEADNLGLMMMARAGYDPIGAVEWLEREIRMDVYRHKKYPHNSEYSGFETHPPVSSFLHSIGVSKNSFFIAQRANPRAQTAHGAGYNRAGRVGAIQSTTSRRNKNGNGGCKGGEGTSTKDQSSGSRGPSARNEAESC